MPKAKRLTVAELKRKMEVGTILTMVEFHGTPVKKRRVVLGHCTTYAKLGGDGIPDNEYSMFNWPKAAELTETADGFICGGKFGSLRYVRGEVKDENSGA
mgnify:CR=1 FL=1